MKIAVIGAGAAGIAAIRQCSSNKIDCTAYEQAGEIGGTWVYTDEVGINEYGFPVHSSMYQGLKTNLPKEVMGYPDFPVPERDESYLTQQEVLDFLNLYVDTFKLRQYIQFFKHVEKIKPIPKGWSITCIDVKTKSKFEAYYDAVMVCTGHYSDPRMPEICGMSCFKGEQFHSHSYRKADIFENKQVLIIGSGPSAIDLTMQALTVAQKVVLSHGLNELSNCQFPRELIIKTNVRRIEEDGVCFMDGTKESVNVICYCTGYNFSFPFLHESCKITVENSHVKPLYKHTINIEHPTMCFIGIPFSVVTFQMFDLQSRYFLKMLHKPLPSKEIMYAHTECEMKKKWERGEKPWKAHNMGEDQGAFYEQLAEEAEIETIPPAVVKLRIDSEKKITEDLMNFRSDIYRIIDNENYIKIN